MEYTYRRNAMSPLWWVLIAVLALALILLVWWAVSASDRDQTVVVPGDQQPVTRPQQQPAQQPVQQPDQQPVVVQPAQPINVYVQPTQEQPRVIIVPQGQQPPQGERNGAQRTDLPGAFRYQNKTWEPTDRGVTRNVEDLQPAGVSVAGREVYIKQDADPPYDEVYLETSSGSGIFVRYNPE